jgi:hypothetical protein
MRNALILIATAAMCFTYGYSVRPEPVETRTVVVTERVCSKVDLYAAAIPASAFNEGRK